MHPKIKSKKVKKNNVKFVHSEVTAPPGLKYGGNDVYSMTVKTQNATYNDMYERVKEIKQRLAKQYPDAKMNVAIKYSSMSKPISAGYFAVDNDNPDVKMPYDFHSDDDTIEHFYVNFTTK